MTRKLLDENSLDKTVRAKQFSCRTQILLFGAAILLFANNSFGAAAPTPPSNLIALGISSTEIDLSWTDNSSNESGFQIDRAPSSGGPWTQVATVGAGVVGFANTGLAPSTTWYYRVRAYNQKNSSYSSVANATTPALACTYSFSPANASFTSAAGSGSVSVSTAGGCAWNASVSDAWITLNSGTSSSGNGVVNYSVAANTTTTSRTGTITIEGQPFNVTQAGAVACAYSCAPTTASFIAAGGSGTVAVTTTSGCAWSANANDAWITIASGNSATGNGTVSYAVTANTGTSSRTGSMIIAGQPFSVTQSGAAASPSLGQALDNTSLSWLTGGNNNWVSETIVSFTGGAAAQSGPISDGGVSWLETTVAGPVTLSFYWKISSESGWDFFRFYLDGIEQPGSISGEVDWQQKSVSIPSGSHTVRWAYTKDPVCCTGGQDRGWLDQVQLGTVSCTYALSSSSSSFPSSGGAGSFNVNAANGCAWSPIPSANWITISSSSSSSGNGTVNYSVSPNSGTTARTGTIAIAGQTFSVLQSGTVPSTSLGQALDNTSLGWTTGGNTNWLTETTVSFFGGSAAQSGPMGDGGVSWLETSVSGPATVSFYWKVSSEYGWDYLRFYLDGVEQPGSISGEVDWQSKSFALGLGSHTLRWAYTKDPQCCTGGQDRGWVDQVQVAATACSYALASSSASLPAAGGAGNVGVTAAGGCSWTASTVYSWIHTTSSGNGSGTVSYTVDANNGTSTRSGTITAGGQTFTINQVGIICAYTLNPTAFSHGAGTETGSFGVTSPAGCNWAASTASSWIHTISSGNGPGTVNYSVDANTSVSSRSGTILVAGQPFTVNQAAVSCSYTLSSTSASIGFAGASGNLNVTATPGCAWTASTLFNWLHTTSSGNGNGTVTYTVDANAGTSLRSGTITVSGQTFTINQAAIICTYALNPTGFNHGAGTGTGSFAVTSPVGCAWAASTASSWLHTISGGGGNGTVNYSVDANTSTNSRSGTIAVGGQNFTVNQPGVSCTYAFSSPGISYPSTGGSGSVTVTALSGCAWTALSTYGWIRTASTGNGNGAVSYSVDPNMSNSSRSGTITAGGQTFTINQAGAPCTYAISPMSASHAAAGGFGTISVTAGSTCSCSATSAAAWLTITAGGSGVGNGTVSYAVAANNLSNPRSSTITISGQQTNLTFTVTQNGTCLPAVVLTAPAAGTTVSNTITLVASANTCATRVEFYCDNLATPLGTAMTTPFTFPCDTTAMANGSHNFYVKAFNALGNSTNSFPVAVTVNNGTTLPPPTGSCVWSKRFGGTGPSDYVSAKAVTADSNGNVVVAGFLGGTADVGGQTLTSAGGGDIFVAKYTSDGALLWAKRFGSTGNDLALALASDSDGNVIVTGSFEGTVNFGGGSLTANGLGDIFLLKLGSDGSFAWCKNFGGSSGNADDTGQSVAVDSAGNILVAGVFFASADFGGGLFSGTSPYTFTAFTAKFSPSGQHLWSKAFDSANATAIAVGPSGNIVIGGYFNTTISFGANSLTSAGSSDIFLAKLDPNGNSLWARRFGDANGQSLSSLSVDKNENIVFGGNFFGSVDFGGGPFSNTGSSDMYLTKFSSSGQHIWSKQFADNSSFGNALYGIATDVAGNVVATGIIQSGMSFGGSWLLGDSVDVFIAKFSSAGDYLWAGRYGGAYTDYGYGIAADRNGNIFGTGTFYYSMSFGCTPLAPPVNGNSFLVRLAP